MWISFLVGVFAVFMALGVIVSKRPMHSAVYLVGNVLSLALFYVLLGASFLAAILVIVYAGAVLVLVLFTVSFLERDRTVHPPTNKAKIGLGVFWFMALVFAVELYPGASHATFLVGGHQLGLWLWGHDFYAMILLGFLLTVAAIGVSGLLGTGGDA